MAKIVSNLILHGVSGMIGHQVVVRRSYASSYVLAAAPNRTRRDPSAAQKAQQERFRQATLYATARQGLPEYQAAAAKRSLSAYTVAAGDFLSPPEILGLDVSGYTGLIGETISIRAVDDVKVASVDVSLVEDDGTPIESGKAQASAQDPLVWVYTSTVKAPSPSVKVLVSAMDLAGQVGSSAGHT